MNDSFISSSMSRGRMRSRWFGAVTFYLAERTAKSIRAMGLKQSPRTSASACVRGPEMAEFRGFFRSGDRDHQLAELLAPGHPLERRAGRGHGVHVVHYRHQP